MTTNNAKGGLRDETVHDVYGGLQRKSVQHEGRIGTVIVKDMSRLGRDYLQVGMYTEMVFPNADIRFIAINNGVDSMYSQFTSSFLALRRT